MEDKVVQEVNTAQWTGTQPWKGIIAVIICVLITIAITLAFSVDKFTGTFTAFCNSVVPIQVVIGLAWGASYPITKKLDQPWRGIALTFSMLMIAGLAYLFLFDYIGGGSVNPVVNVFSINCVLMTFFAVIAFGCWPFQKMSIPARGFLTLIVAYVIAYILTYIFWDFSLPFAEMAGPFSSGVYGWDAALAFFFIMFNGIWVLVSLDMWPINKFPALLKQPAMGITIAILCFVYALICYNVGVSSLGILSLNLMVYFICFTAGILTINIVLQGWPGLKLAQPAKGIVNLIISVILAYLFFKGYSAVSVYNYGVVEYPVSVFVLGNMMLGLTFPLYVTYAALWEYWPLPSLPPASSSESVEE